MDRREGGKKGGRVGGEKVVVEIEICQGPGKREEWRQGGREEGREGGGEGLPRVCSHGSQHARDRAHGIKSTDTHADREGEEGGLADGVERRADGQEGGEGDEV